MASVKNNNRTLIIMPVKGINTKLVRVVVYVLHISLRCNSIDKCPGSVT